MSEQTLNMLKKLSPKKEHSLAFRCFIGAAAIVLLTVSVHILVFTAIEKHSEIRNLPEWYQLLAGLSVDALYPLFIVSLASIIKRVYRYTGTPSGAQGFQVYLSLPWTYRRLQNQHVCGTLCILYGFVCGRHSHIYHHRHTFSLRTV